MKQTDRDDIKSTLLEMQINVVNQTINVLRKEILKLRKTNIVDYNNAIFDIIELIGKLEVKENNGL